MEQKSETNNYSSLTDLLSRGGVYYNLQGGSVKEILTDLVQTIPLPPELQGNILLQAMVEREALMPTAIGDGIALPHPRTPLLAQPEHQLISVCFLQDPISWKALDGKLVHSLICILSSSAREHLRTLSRISYLCRKESFKTLLAHRADDREIRAAIEEAEKQWANT